MKRITLLCLLLVSLFQAAPAQDQVLAVKDGYQLRAGDLRPALEVLVFLTQSELEAGDLQLVIEEAKAEFLAGPAELMESLAQLNTAITTAQSTNDPLALGEFRQLMIGEFYRMALSTPPDQRAAFIQVLFQKAPIVAYDPNTGVALTRPDLEASLLYLQALNAQRGEPVSDLQMQQAAVEIANGFGQLDEETQKLMASGSLLLTIYQTNWRQMTPQQQTSATSHYRTTTGGPPRRTRGGEQEMAATRTLSRDGIANTRQMMDSLKAAGGSDNYWELNKSF